MSVLFTQSEALALLDLPRPDTRALQLSPEETLAVENRISALVELINGAPVQQVARLFDIHRKTLGRMLELAPQPGPGGKPLGFAVCMPGARLVTATPKQWTVPVLAHSHAMTQLVGAISELSTLLSKFKGPLPTRNVGSPSFDRLHREVVKLLRAQGLEEAYPLNTSDRGRRALRTYVQRQREYVLEAGMAQIPDEARLTRLETLFELRPMDRVEFDAHWIDFEGHVAVPLPDGTHVLRPMSGIWLLALIDVASRAVVAWRLVIGSSYHRLDLLRTLSKALVPWTPRELVVDKLRYLPNAWMPSCHLEHGQVPRALLLALDNFKGHTAKQARENILSYQQGMYHFGPSGIPETRGTIEAFFKLFEEQVLRFLAGGFEPETPDRPKQKVSTKRSKDYPVFIEALEELADVAATTYNVSPHSGKHNRSPREVCEQYWNAGGLVLRSRRSEKDAKDLTLLRIQVTVRGNVRKGVLPHVNWAGGRHRSAKTNARWDMVGKTYSATVDDQDVRQLTLLDENGLPYVTLHVLPPYARTAHNLDTRQRAERLRQSSGEAMEGMEDAIEAYHNYVRRQAATIRWATDDIASGAVPPAPRPNKGPPPPISAHPLKGLAPRGGQVRLR